MEVDNTPFFMGEMMPQAHTMAMNHSHDMAMYFVNTIMLHNFMFKGVMVHHWWQYTITLVVIFIASVFNQFLYWIVRRPISYKKANEYEPLEG